METFLFSPFRNFSFQKSKGSTMCRWMSRRPKPSRAQGRSGRMRGNRKCETRAWAVYRAGKLGARSEFCLPELHRWSMQVQIQRESVISVGLARTFGREDIFVHTEWGGEGSRLPASTLTFTLTRLGGDLPQPCLPRASGMLGVGSTDIRASDGGFHSPGL